MTEAGEIPWEALRLRGIIARQTWITSDEDIFQRERNNKICKENHIINKEQQLASNVVGIAYIDIYIIKASNVVGIADQNST